MSESDFFSFSSESSSSIDPAQSSISYDANSCSTAPMETCENSDFIDSCDSSNESHHPEILDQSQSTSSIRSTRSSTCSGDSRSSVDESNHTVDSQTTNATATKPKSQEDPGEGSSSSASHKVEILKSSRNRDILALNGYLFYGNRPPVR